MSRTHKIYSIVTIILVATFLTAGTASAQSSQQGEISLSQFIELLIALDVISPDKVQIARDFASSQKQNEISSVLTRNLYKGVRGEDVSELQKYLTQTGDYTYGEITGYYGSATEEAVKSYQRRNNIVSSGTADTTGYGLVGPRTLSLINQGVGVGLAVASETSSVSENALTEEEKAVLAAQDKSLATASGTYAQGYYQAFYQASYTYQGLYQGYYQNSYYSQGSYIAPQVVPVAPVAKVYGPNEIITLPVYVHLLRSSYSSVQATFSSGQITNIFNSGLGVNEHFWKQANIRWDLKEIRTHTITNGSDQQFAAAVSSGNEASVIDLMPSLADGATLSEGFNIFVVHDLTSLPGTGRYYDGVGIVFISELNNRSGDENYTAYITSHELGHALTLGHVGDSANIMATGVNVGALSRDQLTADQITKARAQAAFGVPGNL